MAKKTTQRNLAKWPASINLTGLVIRDWTGRVLHDDLSDVGIEVRAQPGVVETGNGPALIRIEAPLGTFSRRTVHADVADFTATLREDSGGHGTMIFAPGFLGIRSGSAMVLAGTNRLEMCFDGASRPATKNDLRARGATVRTSPPACLSGQPAARTPSRGDQ